MKHIRSILVAVLLLLLSACSLRSFHENTNLDKHKEIKTFDIEDRYGETFNLADYKGKRIIIKVWGTWCPICNATLEQLDELANQAKENDMVFISIMAPGTPDELSKEELIQFFDDHQINDTYVVFDSQQQYLDEFDIKAMPSMILIDENFEVIFNSGGSISFSEIINLFEK